MRALHTHTLQPGQKIRVLVVDDSVVIRRLVCHALEEDPAVEIVGVASSGSMGLDRIPQVNPDVITLDIEMPDMDGLQMLRELRRQGNDIRVIMFSTMTERGGSATLEALALGADDYVTKASNAGSLDVSMTNLRLQLLPKIHQFFRIEGAPKTMPGVSRLAVPTGESRKAWAPQQRFRPQAVGIGVSTGGPAALTTIMPLFPADFPLPVFVVQHMPPLFTRLLAERLGTVTRLPVKEAEHGEKPEPGRIYIAPGDFHMRIANTPTGVEILLDKGSPLNSCRPAVDALFGSMAAVYSGAVIAAVLTGMGQDGLRGAQRLKAQGARILAQDEASSVVWGMPGAVANAGAADEVLPLLDVVPAILRQAAGACLQ